MKKIVVFGVLAALALAVPVAQAVEYAPAPPPKPHKPDKPPKSHKCAPHSVGYNATGTLIAANLTASGKRYSGTLEVQVRRANHHGLTGDESFTLSSVKVVFHHGVDAQNPAAGSKVKLHGKVTQLAKKCPTEGFTPAVTIRKVDIHQAKHS